MTFISKKEHECACYVYICDERAFAHECARIIENTLLRIPFKPNTLDRVCYFLFSATSVVVESDKRRVSFANS